METYWSHLDDHHLSSSQQQHHEHVGFFGSVLGGAYLLFVIIPLWLWHLYIEYLWKWDEHPLIKNTAATFRLLALLVITPFALLTLLDVGAYVIARTLGVVETTKASTSDLKIPSSGYSSVDSSETSIEQTGVPSSDYVDVVDVGCGPHEAGQRDAREASTTSSPSPSSTPSSSVSSSSGSASSTILKLKRRFTAEHLTIPEPSIRFSRSSQGAAAADDDGPEAEARFYNPSDERQLELSGALLSSPTPSRQGSPGIERRHKLQPLTQIRVQTMDRVQPYDIDAAAAKAASATGDDASSPTDSSDPFVVLERPPELARDGPEGFEGSRGFDPALEANVNLRQRGTTSTR